MCTYILNKAKSFFGRFFTFKRTQYYYTTCKVSIEGKVRYMKWLAKSEDGYFPVSSVIASFMMKYKAIPVIINVVEISRNDYMNLMINIRENHEKSSKEKQESED